MLVSTWDAYTAVQRPGDARDGAGPSSPTNQFNNQQTTSPLGNNGNVDDMQAIPDPMDLLSPPLATYVYDPTSFSPFLAFSPSNTPMSVPLVTPAPAPPPPLAKSVPKLGVLQLNTSFPRPPGDVGNPASWPMPTVIRVVEEAKTATVLSGMWGSELVDAFVREGKKMMAEEGVVAFVTSCGYVSWTPCTLTLDAMLKLLSLLQCTRHCPPSFRSWARVPSSKWRGYR